MGVSHSTTESYAATLERLETELRAGRARHAAWAAEEKELMDAIAALKAVIARQGGRQILLPLAGRGVGVPNEPGAFRGLSYRAATQKYFEMAGHPLTAPEVADGLFNAGFAKSRKTIKVNVDSAFKKLRDDGIINRTAGPGSPYALVGHENGSHPPNAD